MTAAYAKQESDMILSTLDKGLHILEVLGGANMGRGASLTELSRAVGMHRTTLLRILTTLQARGFVQRDRVTDHYRIGIKMLSLTASLLRNLDVREIARPHLHALCQHTEELVLLTVLDEGAVVTVEQLEGAHTISLRTELGARRPAYCTASGKVFLAYAEPDAVARILAGEMPPVTPRTITTPAAMAHHLEAVRERGYAWDDEERIEGVRCVAAPVFDFEGRAVAAVSVATPSLRTPWSRLRELGVAAGVASAAISRDLGYCPRGEGTGNPTTANATAPADAPRDAVAVASFAAGGAGTDD